MTLRRPSPKATRDSISIRNEVRGLLLSLLLLPCSAAGNTPIVVTIASLEPVQITQDSRGSVPLIAGKATVVRAFISSTSVQPLRITADLNISIAEKQFLPSLPQDTPFSLPADDRSLDKARSDLSRTLNWVVPAAQVTEGLALSVTIKSVLGQDGKPRDFTCSNCSVAHPVPVLANVLPLRLHIVKFSYTEPGGNVRVPSADDVAAVESWLLKALPAGNTDVSFVPAVLREDPILRTCIDRHWAEADETNPQCCLQVNAQLLRKLEEDWPDGSPEHYYGLVPEDSTHATMRGCANKIPGVYDLGAVASGTGGAVTRDSASQCLDPKSIAGCKAVHEVGHLLGRHHPGSCANEEKGDPCFPYASGLLAPPSDYVGIDIINAERTNRRLVLV
jgi:hypothetical protein